MNFKTAHFRLDQIDCEDGYYKISDSYDLSRLIASIKTVGLINPPILIRKKNTWTIVSGFARIEASKRSGALSIDARTLDERTPKRESICLAVTENASQRDLSLTEQSRVVRLLTELVHGCSQVAALANSLGLQMNVDLCEKLLQVSQMPDRLHTGLARGTIALPTALHIFRLRNETDIDALTVLFDTLNLSLNRQREMLGWIEAIAMRERLSVCDVVGAAAVQSTLHDENLDLKQRSQNIRFYLKRRRYPAITVAENRFSDNCHELSLPKGVQLIPPPGFEGPDYTLKISFDGPQPLARINDRLKDVIHSAAFQRIFDPTL